MKKMWLLGLCAAAAVPVIPAFSARGVGTSNWTHTSEADFKTGTFDNVVATNLGDLKLSRAVRMLLRQNPKVSSVNALVQAADGTIYAGTGPQAVILKIVGDEVTELATIDDATHIFALALDKDGGLLIGASGEAGRVLKMAKPGDKPTELFKAEGVQYVWSLAQTDDGNIYAATGPNGQLFEISAPGQSRVVLDADENNLLSLVSDGKDLLYVGTDPHGLVYKVNRKSDDSFIVYDAPEAEVSALAIDKAGNVYAGTAEAREEPQPPKAPIPPTAGRPESQPSGVPIPSKPPTDPEPPKVPDPTPGQPDPIPKATPSLPDKPAAPEASQPDAEKAKKQNEPKPADPKPAAPKPPAGNEPNQASTGAKGQVYDRWRYFRYIPDWRGARLMWRARRDLRPSSLLGLVVDELGSSGIQLINSTEYCPEHVVTPGVLTRRQPTDAQWKDIRNGWAICQTVSRLDIGQSIAVLENDVIAVEAVEGTDAMIERAGRLCAVGGWTMIKVSNTHQDMRVDVPTIGTTTIEKLAAARAGCLVLEAGKTVILEKQKVLELADRHKIAVVGLDKPPAAESSAEDAGAHADHR